MASRERISVTTSSLLRLERLRSTSISAECTPSACSSSSARPVRRPTVLTSGTCRMSRSAIRPTRLDSASEMPGRSSIEMVSVPSLKGGRKERGRNKALKAASATAKIAATMTKACCPKAQSSSRRLPALSTRTSQESPWLQAPHLRQQVVAEHRRDGDRGDEARKDGDDVGDAERRKQPALDARTAQTAARTPG